MTVAELEALRRSQERVLGELLEVNLDLSEAEVRRDRLVAEARRLAVTWERIGDAVGMAKQNAWRKWT